MKNGTNRRPPCDWAVERIHARLDGDRLDPPCEARLERHLASCASCSRAADELARLQSNLRELSEAPLPEECLEQVWGRTSRRRWFAAGSWSLPHWGLAAAAATLAFVLIGVSRLAEPTGVSPDPRVDLTASERQDVDRAVAELKLVFGVTAQALHRTESTLDEVFVERISPALQKTPLPWLRRAKGKDDA